jgi:hypothetical protein
LVLIAVSILIFNKELIQVPKIDLSLNSTTWFQGQHLEC